MVGVAGPLWSWRATGLRFGLDYKDTKLLELTCASEVIKSDISNTAALAAL